MDAAITVSGLGKRFRRRGADAPSTLKEAILRGGRGLRGETFWGLRDVSFTVAQGRTVGIVGRNGAGKSTLLRLIGQVGRPDTGRVQTRGRIGALLDLGAGLHPDLTGRENIFVAGVIGGMTRAEVTRRFDEIVAFAELEAFIASPLRTYSTGMRMRLAFAVAVHIDPQILLIDEVLAVGDLAFQRKCLERIDQFKRQGCTILIVSHEPGQLRDLCDEVIWMRDGAVAARGPTAQVLAEYVAQMAQSARLSTPAIAPQALVGGGALVAGVNRFGSQALQIAAVRLLGPEGRPLAELASGGGLCVELDYHAPAPVVSPRAVFSLHRRDGPLCLDASTEAAGLELPTLHGGGTIRLAIERLDLAGGDYVASVGIYDHDWLGTYDYHWQAYPLQVTAAAAGKGVLRPPLRWVLAQGGAGPEAQDRGGREGLPVRRGEA